MRRQVRRSWSGWWLIALTACEPQCDPVDPSEDDTDVDTVDTDTDRPDTDVEEAFHVDKQIEETFAVERDRFVVRLDAPGACPEPLAGWSMARLFSDDETPLDPRVDTYTDLLSFFCVYDRVDSTGAPEPFSDVTGPTVRPVDIGEGFGNHERLGLGEMSVDLNLLHDAMYSRFVFGAGVARLDPTPTGGDLAALPIQATVALLDSAPDSSGAWPEDTTPFQGPPGHGLWMAAFVQQLTCPDSVECPVNLVTRQVLGRTRTSHNGNAPDGAVWGTLGDLARGIVRTVRLWEAGGPRRGPLVLNMSVGWHPYFGGGAPGVYEIGADGAELPGDGSEQVFSWSKVDPSSFPPDVRAVFDALAYARCKGALSFAAAGNATGGPVGGSGPLLPAGWEGLDTSKIPTCAALGADSPVAPTVVDPALPLVVAVGGVDAEDRDLSVSRPGSRPLIVANGDHARFKAEFSQVATQGPTLTGTSVSTVVASSAAAAIWTLDTTLTAKQVLDRLISSGTPVQPVDGWSTHALEQRHATEVLYPDAAEEMMSRRVKVCHQLIFSQVKNWVCKEDALQEIGDFGQGTEVDQVVGTWPGAAETDPVCGARQLFRAATAGDAPVADPCPSLQYYGPSIAPWVLPQPETAGCSDCFLDVGAGQLYIELDNLWLADGLVMTVKAASGDYEFALPASSIPDNQTTLTVSFNPASAPAGINQATLTVLRLGRSVILPVLVIGN